MSDADVQAIGSEQDLEMDEAQTRLAESPMIANARDAEAATPHALASIEPAKSTRPASRPSGKRKSSNPPARDRRIGQVLSGRYRLEKLIGKGGMGRVYLATQFPLNRAVAVKILNPDFQRKDPQFVRRFFLEAATAARLSHPNTITVFDYGETDRKELYIAMEYLKGKPLSRVLSKNGPFTGDRAMHVALQIVRALREAHSKGIIHRDLKPGNIMLLEEGDDADYAKVLDFGLVKLFSPGGDSGVVDLLTPSQQGDDLTKAGMFLGSPKYMSPEQIQGADLDPRTDIYSLGIIMYQMLAGRPPFRGGTSVEIIYKHVNEAVPRIHDFNPDADCPIELEELVMKCLEKKRENRFESMSELRTALRDTRRLLTGISSTSASGIASDIIALRQRAANDPSVVAAAARNASTPPVVAEPISEEAAFVDHGVHEDSKSEVSLSFVHRGGRPSALMRAAPYLAGLSLVLVLGTLAYVIASSPGPVPQEPAVIAPTRKIAAKPPEPPKPLVTKVALQSNPAGAAVTEGGRLLGVTPFVHSVELKDKAPQTHTYTFTKDGYKDKAVKQIISGDSVTIAATMEKKVAAKPKVKPKRPRRPKKARPAKNSSEYKDNPY